ncbi:MAG: 2-succinyl-6-hydroxy-2,4-cyclohexadiene-1-carboxylate synthase [candidate division Zixibacteria bacterium]|nr:2-succinyl-6-hydroxy-2,4-cyclohexadiene-1-carboxylate synthase [candidate division Zixibacteria bacterium]
MADLIKEWNVYRAGDNFRRPILFLHGFMGSGKIWLPVIEQLQDSYYCLALDLPGHGETKANLGNLFFDTLAESLISFIDDNCNQPPIIIGYSMGGRIALYTAIKYPEKFHSIVLESSSPGIADGFERQKRLLSDRTVSEKFLQTDMRSFLIDWYKQPVFNYLSEKQGLTEKIIDKKSSGNPEFYSKVVIALSPGRQIPLWNKLPFLFLPVLIIAGEIDQKYCEIGRRMTDALPKSRLEIIKNAGHIVHLENRKDFMSALNSFLS